MNIDLHCHTNVSDGALPPQELVDLAVERNIDVLSITDHDSLAAYSSIVNPSAKLRIIPGIEFSTYWKKSGVHIVGLDLDLSNSTLLDAVAQQSAARELRAEKIAQKLAHLGFDNCLEGAKSYTSGGQVGRPHFAQHLVAIGAVANIQQAFKRYLGAGKPGDIKEQWAEMATVVEWIRGAGGIAVLAHPTKYKMTGTKLSALIRDFSEVGGEAMEVISGLQIPSLTRDMANLARKNGLLASCGSDFHSPDQPWAALGMVAQLPDSCTPIWSRWA
ncbi:MAG: PHP domain-containing protein [Porticoccaceae bacterium]|jgi:predicted metal-dependent phosphoesterase TrpH|nr:PHP domain-containing protein [Porticoccaceae bacterium]MBT5577454.1 PHP domain-containing protein [Porticoccaceae bacterium]MBT7375096.1 PHP domain-containing protein [Porticoccaceae bacterium]